MRAVNLLPSEAQRRSRSAPNQAVLAAAIAGVVVVAAIGGGNLLQSSRVASAQNALNAAKLQLAGTPLPPATPHVTPPPAVVAAQMQPRLQAVTAALSTRIAWDRLLREFSLVLPSDVQLTQLQLTASGSELFHERSPALGRHVLVQQRRPPPRPDGARPRPDGRDARHHDRQGPDRDLLGERNREGIGVARGRAHPADHHDDREQLVKKNVSLSLSLPKPAQFALVGVGAALVLLLGWMVLLGPKQKQVSNINAQTAAVNQQIADDLTRASTARGADNAPTLKVADVYKLTTAMPSILDMPDLLLELDQTASAAGVTLDSMSPGQPTTASTSGYSTLDVDLNVTGNFYSLTDLLYRLRNLVYVRSGALQANGRIFSVTSVNLTPADNVVTAAITLTTYVYGSVPTPELHAGPRRRPPRPPRRRASSSGPSAAGATP